MRQLEIKKRSTYRNFLQQLELQTLRLLALSLHLVLVKQRRSIQYHRNITMWGSLLVAALTLAFLIASSTFVLSSSAREIMRELARMLSLVDCGPPQAAGIMFGFLTGICIDAWTVEYGAGRTNEVFEWVFCFSARSREVVKACSSGSTSSESSAPIVSYTSAQCERLRTIRAIPEVKREDHKRHVCVV